MESSKKWRDQLRGESRLPDDLSWGQIGPSIMDGVRAVDHQSTDDQLPPYWISIGAILLVVLVVTAIVLHSERLAISPAITHDSGRSGLEQTPHYDSEAILKGETTDVINDLAQPTISAGGLRTNTRIDNSTVIESRELVSSVDQAKAPTRAAAAQAKSRDKVPSTTMQVSNEGQAISRTMPMAEMSLRKHSMSEGSISSVHGTTPDGQYIVPTGSKAEGSSTIVGTNSEAPATVVRDSCHLSSLVTLSAKSIERQRAIDQLYSPQLAALPVVHRTSSLRLQLGVETGASLWSYAPSGDALVNDRASYESGVAGHHVTISGDLKVGKSIALRLGVRYRQLRSLLDYDVEVPVEVLGTVTINDRDPVSGQITTTSREQLLQGYRYTTIRHHNTTRVYSIPVQMTHTWSGDSPWSAVAGFGGEYILASKRVGRTLEVDDTESGLYRSAPIQNNSYEIASTIGVSASAMASYQLYSKIELTAGIHLYKSVSDWASGSAVWRPGIIDIGVGLRYSL